MSKFLDETGLAYFWNKIKAALSTVAFTGSYNDLSNKPNIPASSIVDTALSSTSTNPVQNKVITAELATKVTASQAVAAVASSGYVTSTYVAGATVASAGIATNATNVAGTAGTSTLSWNTDVTLYTVGGHAIKAKLPANPNTNTTYTFATGDANGQIKVTPSGGTAQNVDVKGLGTAAYTASTAYAAASHTHSYLPLAGGTLTGSLTISRGNPYLYFVETDWSKGTPQTSGTSYQGIYFSGSNAEGGHITFHYQQDKASYLQLVCQNLTSAGANANTSIFVATAADGTKHVRPGANNDTDLGLSGYKWKTVYATTFSGALAGNATTATTAGNVTGTVAIANGGTGATTRLNAIKALTNENVSTNATHFLGLKSDWSKVGYFSLAECKTLLGLGTAAYTASTAYASANHTHSYLPLTGGTLTGALNQSCAVPTYNCFDTDLTKGTNPSSAQWLGLLFCDKTGNSGTKYRAGAVETNVTKTGETQTYLRAYNWKADTATEEHIAICYPKDGTPYTIAPTPATSDNSTKIATTAYVKAQGYITSSGSITGSSGSCTGNSNTATTATYLSVPTYTGDLNALETSGVYYVNDGTNYPVGSNGQVIVIKKGNFIRQFFFRAGTINSNEYQNYSREKNISTGEWGEWYWFVNSKHLPLSIARGGTGSETRLGAVKALLNESVTSPDYFLGITTSWAKGGYVSIANAKTALGVNIYANIKIGHINGNATYTLPSGGTWAWALIKDGRGTPSKTGSNAGGTVLKNDWDTDWGAVYIAVRTA